MTHSLLLITFTGLPLGSLLGVGFAAAALVGLLYFLKLKRRRAVVPFLGLFESLLLDRKASAWRSRLQRLFSLLISLLIVAALVFALGNPRSEQTDSGRSVILIVDVSASMGTETSGNETRLDAAKSKAKEWLPHFDQDDEVLILEMGAKPRPVRAFSSERSQLKEGIDSLQVLDVAANLESALLLSRDVLRGRKHGEIIVLSDGALPELSLADSAALPKLKFEPIDFKKEAVAGNLAITAFSARRYPLSGDRYEVLIEVLNSSDKDAEVELSLAAAQPDGNDGEVVEVSRFTVGAEERFSRSYENLAQADGGLVARLRRVDKQAEPLDADNVARTLLSPRLPVRILVVGEPNNFLEAALLVEESFSVTRVGEQSYPPPGDFDVTIFDGVFPDRVPRTGAALYLGAPEPDISTYPVARGETIESFGFDTWKKNSVAFRLIDPYDVQVLRGKTFRPQSDDLVLGASEGRPIFVQGKNDEGAYLALGFSPRDSDFVLRAVWPLFVVNLVDELFPRGRGETLLGLKTGEVWRVPVEALADETHATIVGPLSDPNPNSHRVPLENGRALFYGQRAGFYDARTREGQTRFSASLLASGEGQFAPKTELVVQGKAVAQAGPMPPKRRDDPWYWLLLGVFAVSFIEWWAYHRRWTV